jgi:thiol-disulfide isomerase/thioredoxin
MNGAPPPVPTASKPDLAALQASKPKPSGGRSQGQDIMELTPATFDQVVLHSGRPTLVDFYLPWCVPCQEFAPTYEEVAQSFSPDRVVIAKFDNGNHKAIGERYGVNCWPTLLWFDGHSDNPIDYRPLGRGWDKRSLNEFVQENAGVAAQTAQAPSSTAGSCLHCRDFSGPDNHAARFPRQSLPSADVGWLANQLTAQFPSHTDKARAIFTWLHHNVAYDVVSYFQTGLKPSTPQGTIQSGLAVCEGYAGLFSALALKAGLECIVLSGASKGGSYQPMKPGDPMPVYKMSHAWNVVRLDGGEWKLIDSCWGAGNVNNSTQTYEKSFKPYWFTMTNKVFGYSHYPPDAAQQYLGDGSIFSWEAYNNTPKYGCVPKHWDGCFQEEGMDWSSIQPNVERISLRDQPGPTVRFAFQKICPHWDPVRSGQGPLYAYALQVDGLKDTGYGRDMVVLETNGEVWWADVPVRSLGFPGQKVTLSAITKSKDLSARGITQNELKRRILKEGFTRQYVCEWEMA